MRDFFLGRGTARELSRELERSVIPIGPDDWAHPVEPMSESSVVEPDHLARVCAAVVGGELRPEWLQSKGFCLLSSDAFDWDADSSPGALVVGVLDQWSAPEINIPLTVQAAGRRQAQLSGQQRL